MNHTCRVCGLARVHEQLDFGPQAIRNRFLRSPSEAEYAHPLAIGYCESCGTVQLIEPPPVSELRPRVEWIRYNEPEGHLDAVVDGITKLAGVARDSRLAGLTYKDDSTLARLNRLGFSRTWRPEVVSHLGIDAPFSGIESVQAKLSPDAADHLAAKFGQPDVLFVRHVLEHTHDTQSALQWAARLVRPGGYVVFEVPDAVRALDRLDYTTVWEEHTLYFSQVTLRGCFERAGYEVVSLESYPYTLENSLVLIARSVGARHRPARLAPLNDIERAKRFICKFGKVRDLTRRKLNDYDRIAMLGAGHLTGAFLNVYNLANRVEFVADDNVHKQGLFMPGSRLPILPSSALLTRDIDLCLMTVRPEIEETLAKKNCAFIKRGGVLASVFPDSAFSLDRIASSLGVA